MQVLTLATIRAKAAGMHRLLVAAADKKPTPLQRIVAENQAHELLAMIDALLRTELKALQGLSGPRPLVGGAETPSTMLESAPEASRGPAEGMVPVIGEGLQVRTQPASFLK